MLMGKMMVDLLAFIILLAIVLCSFGVARQVSESFCSLVIVKFKLFNLLTLKT